MGVGSSANDGLELPRYCQLDLAAAILEVSLSVGMYTLKPRAGYEGTITQFQ